MKEYQEYINEHKLDDNILYQVIDDFIDFKEEELIEIRGYVTVANNINNKNHLILPNSIKYKTIIPIVLENNLNEIIGFINTSVDFQDYNEGFFCTGYIILNQIGKSIYQNLKIKKLNYFFSLIYKTTTYKNACRNYIDYYEIEELDTIAISLNAQPDYKGQGSVFIVHPVNYFFSKKYYQEKINKFLKKRDKQNLIEIQGYALTFNKINKNKNNHLFNCLINIYNQGDYIIPMLINHSENKCIGFFKTVDIIQDNHGLLVKGYIFADEQGKYIAQQIINNKYFAFSVCTPCIKFQNYYNESLNYSINKATLLEISVTDNPANDQALLHKLELLNTNKPRDINYSSYFAYQYHHLNEIINIKNFKLNLITDINDANKASQYFIIKGFVTANNKIEKGIKFSRIKLNQDDYIYKRIPIVLEDNTDNCIGYVDFDYIQSMKAGLHIKGQIFKDKLGKKICQQIIAKKYQSFSLIYQVTKKKGVTDKNSKEKYEKIIDIQINAITLTEKEDDNTYIVTDLSDEELLECMTCELEVPTYSTFHKISKISDFADHNEKDFIDFEGYATDIEEVDFENHLFTAKNIDQISTEDKIIPVVYNKDNQIIGYACIDDFKQDQKGLLVKGQLLEKTSQVSLIHIAFKNDYSNYYCSIIFNKIEFKDSKIVKASIKAISISRNTTFKNQSPIKLYNNIDYLDIEKVYIDKIKELVYYNDRKLIQISGILINYNTIDNQHRLFTANCFAHILNNLHNSYKFIPIFLEDYTNECIGFFRTEDLKNCTFNHNIEGTGYLFDNEQGKYITQQISEGIYTGFNISFRPIESSTENNQGLLYTKYDCADLTYISITKKPFNHKTLISDVRLMINSYYDSLYPTLISYKYYLLNNLTYKKYFLSSLKQNKLMKISGRIATYSNNVPNNKGINFLKNCFRNLHTESFIPIVIDCDLDNYVGYVNLGDSNILSDELGLILNNGYIINDELGRKVYSQITSGIYKGFAVFYEILSESIKNTEKDVFHYIDSAKIKAITIVKEPNSPNNLIILNPESSNKVINFYRNTINKINDCINNIQDLNGTSS